MLLGGIRYLVFFYRKKDNLKMNVTTEKPQIGYISKSVTATGYHRTSGYGGCGFTGFRNDRQDLYGLQCKVIKGQLIAEMDKSLFDSASESVQSQSRIRKSHTGLSEKAI